MAPTGCIIFTRKAIACHSRPGDPRATEPRGAALRRTDKRGADRGVIRTGSRPRTAPFRRARSAVRAAASSAATLPSTATTNRTLPFTTCIADGRGGKRTTARLPSPLGGEAKASPSRRQQFGQHLVEALAEQGARRIAQARHRIRRRRPGEILKLATWPVYRRRLHKAVQHTIAESSPPRGASRCHS